MNLKILCLLGFLVGSVFAASAESYSVFLKLRGIGEGEKRYMKVEFEFGPEATVADLKSELAKRFGKKIPQASGCFLLCKNEIGTHIVYDYEQLNTIFARGFVVKKCGDIPIGFKLPDEIDDLSGDQPNKKLFAELLKHQNFLWKRLQKFQGAVLSPARSCLNPNILAWLEGAYMVIGDRVNAARSNIKESGGAPAIVAAVDDRYADA